MEMWIFLCVGLVILFTCIQYLLCLRKAVSIKAKHLYSPLAWLSILFFVLGMMYLLWYFRIFDGEISELFTITLLFYTAVAYFYSILFLKLRNTIYLNVLKWVYLAIIPIGLWKLDFGAIGFVSASFLFASSLSLLRNLKDHLFKICVSVMLCSAFVMASMSIQLLTQKVPLAFFISPLFLTVSAMVLKRHLEECEYKIEVEKHDFSFPIIAVRTFFFVMILLIFSLSITIIFHELGHAVAANLVGCSNPHVVFSLTDYPYTQASCKEGVDLILWAGAASTVLVSIALIIARPIFSSYLGYLIMGLGFFLSADDLSQIGVKKYVYALFLFASFFLSAWGLIRLLLYSYNRNQRHKHVKTISVECLS